jgi:hypothetical protein
MKLIELSKRGKNRGKYFAQVDDADYEWLNSFNWNLKEYKNTIYVRSAMSKNGKMVTVYMHRFIMGVDDENIQVDHKDHNTLNHQRHNLRKCTRSQNQMNKRPRGSSKFLGVSKATIKSKHKRKDGTINTNPSIYWLSRIRINGKSKNLGYFKSEIEAAIAYDEAAKIHHVEFANLNFK